MRVLVSGSHGFIGSALVTRLRELDHDVTRLARMSGEQDDVVWNPATGDIELEELEGFDAVVHLGGVSIGEHRWTTSEKLRIWDSRINSTEFLSTRLSQVVDRPSVFVCASAVGYYGSHEVNELTESSPNGEGFLAHVCNHWEDATNIAANVGIRVVNLRSGVVLGAHGGALAKQLPLFRAGLGGRLGSGLQFFPWISLRDEVNAIIHAITHERLSGPVNLVGPEQITNYEFTRSLGKALHRPTAVPAWPWLLRIAFGRQLTEEMLLASQRVSSRKLSSSGYQFQDKTLDDAIAHILDQLEKESEEARAKKARDKESKEAKKSKDSESDQTSAQPDDDERK